MSFKCEFCQKELKTKYSLEIHQKNAKYCLKARGEIQNNHGFTCNYCEKNYSTNQRLKDHLNKCIKYQIHINEENKKVKDNEIYQDQCKKYEEQIKDLQDKITKLADKAISKPTNSTTNNYNQYNHVQSINLNPDYVENIVNEKLTFKDICKGKEGYLDFMLENLLKDDQQKIIAWVPDLNRKNILYKNEDGDIVRDPCGFNLVKNTVPAVLKRGKEITKMFHETYYKKDKDGNNILKTSEEIEDEIEEEIEDEDDYKDSDGKKTLFLVYQKVSKLVEEINQFKTGYNPEKITFYFDKLVEGLEELAFLTKYCDRAAKELSLRLPNKPKLINIQEILGEDINKIY